MLTQLATLEERTKYLQGLEEKIESVKDKQDSDSRELREKLYGEYSKRLQDAVSLLKETYGKMSETTTDAFREITDRNVEVYRETARQLVNITKKLESAFERLEQREHTQMREEMKTLKQKIVELERDPLRVQLEELAEARTAQAVHELIGECKFPKCYQDELYRESEGELLKIAQFIENSQGARSELKLPLDFKVLPVLFTSYSGPALAQSSPVIKTTLHTTIAGFFKEWATQALSS